MKKQPCCEVRIKRVGPNRFKARVVACMDVLTGSREDRLGAEAEGASPADAIADASEKLLAFAKADPALAASLLPFVGPEVSAIMVASRYLNAPEVLRDVAKEAKRIVEKTARELRPAIRKAKRIGRATAKVAKKTGRIIESLKFW